MPDAKDIYGNATDEVFNYFEIQSRRDLTCDEMAEALDLSDNLYADPGDCSNPWAYYTPIRLAEKVTTNICNWLPIRDF